jgi:hypothetical protein
VHLVGIYIVEVVIYYGRFGITYRSHSLGSRTQRKPTNHQSTNELRAETCAKAPVDIRPSVQMFLRLNSSLGSVTHLCRHFHLLVAVLVSTTGEPTSEQDTMKEMKHTSTSSLWVQQGKPIKCNILHYEHRKWNEYTECPIRYRTRHSFNNSNTNKDSATKFEQHMLWCHVSHTTNVLLFKFRCNIFIGVRIIKEMSGSVASGTPCITTYKWQDV